MFKKILSACQGEIACRRAAVTTFRMLLVLCLVGAAASSMAQEEVLAKDMREEIVRIQVTVKDLYGRQETKPVPITIYRPEGEGPFPLLVFNHGRATSDLRAKQGRSRPEHLARYFTAKGFVVLAPTRIGYWETYGDFDPEDNRSCNDMRVEAMSTAASDQVMAAVRASPELVALGKDGRDQERFTSREMIATEARLERAGDELARSSGHDVSDRHRACALEAAEGRGLVLSGEQRNTATPRLWAMLVSVKDSPLAVMACGLRWGRSQPSSLKSCSSLNSLSSFWKRAASIVMFFSFPVGSGQAHRADETRLFLLILIVNHT